jgi:chemotaxis receptor (MCP) glutamine deamidase CheD
MMLNKLFEQESRKKTKCYVRIDDTVVRDSDYVFHIDLGSCSSVVLCGMDPDNKVWIGINHLFKSRDKNMDMALLHVSELYNSLTEKNVSRIHCLGLFGAGYRKNSPAREVARKNIMTTLEALSIYNLTIELFQTGFSQGITILKSDERNSFLLRHHNIGSKETKIIEIPLSKIFG